MRWLRIRPTPLNWIVAGIVLAVLPLSFVAAGTSVLPGDVATTLFVQSHVPTAMSPLIVAANLLGEGPVMILAALVVSAILMSRGQRRFAMIVAAASLAQVANVVLKLTLESPRPGNGVVAVSEQASGFGFPSGHTMSVTVLALVLCYVATTLVTGRFRRRTVQAGLLLMPLLVGLARVETGAHWPSDVLGAWLWGTLAAISIIRLSQRSWSIRPAAAYRSARSVKSNVVIADMQGD